MKKHNSLLFGEAHLGVFNETRKHLAEEQGEACGLVGPGGSGVETHLTQLTGGSTAVCGLYCVKLYIYAFGVCLFEYCISQLCKS